MKHSFKKFLTAYVSVIILFLVVSTPVSAQTNDNHIINLHDFEIETSYSRQDYKLILENETYYVVEKETSKIVESWGLEETSTGKDFRTLSNTYTHTYQNNRYYYGDITTLTLTHYVNVYYQMINGNKLITNVTYTDFRISSGIGVFSVDGSVYSYAIPTIGSFPTNQLSAHYNATILATVAVSLDATFKAEIKKIFNIEFNVNASSTVHL